MSTARKNPALETNERHAFGGCNNLQSQYQVIGKELRSLDYGLSRYGLLHNYENFRIGVSSIPVEVLESYFEDLLDIDITEERLYIYRRSMGHFFQILSIIGLLGAFGWGLWSVARGAALVLSFFFTIFMSAPFAILWHFSPRIRLVRRLGFARILSQEIFRRRGGDKDQGQGATSGVFSEFLSPRGVSRTLPGAARRIYH